MIESVAPVPVRELDGLVMAICGEYSLDHGEREVLEAFHRGNPPPPNAPFFGLVSHPPLPPSEAEWPGEGAPVFPVEALGSQSTIALGNHTREASSAGGGHRPICSLGLQNFT